MPFDTSLGDLYHTELWASAGRSGIEYGCSILRVAKGSSEIRPGRVRVRGRYAPDRLKTKICVARLIRTLDSSTSATRFPVSTEKVGRKSESNGLGRVSSVYPDKRVYMRSSLGRYIYPDLP